MADFQSDFAENKSDCNFVWSNKILHCTYRFFAQYLTEFPRENVAFLQFAPSVIIFALEYYLHTCPCYFIESQNLNFLIPLVDTRLSQLLKTTSLSHPTIILSWKRQLFSRIRANQVFAQIKQATNSTKSLVSS